jgi:Fe-S cluster biogenesis protein NfuA
MKDEEKIKEVLEKLRPFLISDGGNIEFVKYEDRVVYIRMMGACANCQMIDYTLKDGIEAAIQEEVPDVLEVVNIGSFDLDMDDENA